MPRLSTAERYNIRFRRLVYGDIKLVPAYDPSRHPFDQEVYRDKWHVPGRKIESTEALVRRATCRSIPVTLVEHSGVNVEMTRLN